MARGFIVTGVVGLLIAGCPDLRRVHVVDECPGAGLTCLDCPDAPACVGDGGLESDGGVGSDAGHVDPPNLIFVTQGTYAPGTLGDGDGGVPVADAVCANDATFFGYSGHFIALLSTSKVAAKDRVPPGVRGWVLAPRYGLQLERRALDVLGEPWVFGPVPGPIAATGSTDWGTSKGPNCDDWTNGSPSSTYRAGDPFRVFPGWLDATVRTCDVPAALYCLQIDFNAPQPRTVPPSVPRAFVTGGQYRPGRGLAGFDADCAAEAARAGLSGIFQAYLPTESNSAKTRFQNVPGTFHRLDGVPLGEYGSRLSAMPLQVTADLRLLVPDGGTWPDSPLLLPTDTAVWSGASDESADGSLSTCTDWLSPAGVGFVRDATGVSWGSAARSCSEAAHLDCVEVR